jgi:DNA-directed RNA polymerase subunit RPC12/RpoP
MPNVTTWRCLACRRELGTATGPTLAVDASAVVEVLATPRGLVVRCPDCGTERLWTWRPHRAA